MYVCEVPHKMKPTIDKSNYKAMDKWAETSFPTTHLHVTKGRMEMECNKGKKHTLRALLVTSTPIL